jgi:hypothetical protein
MVMTTIVREFLAAKIDDEGYASFDPGFGDFPQHCPALLLDLCL